MVPTSERTIPCTNLLPQTSKCHSDPVRRQRASRIRHSVPRPADLHATISEAERTLAELAGVREEIERVMAALRMG